MRKLPEPAGPAVFANYAAFLQNFQTRARCKMEGGCLKSKTMPCLLRMKEGSTHCLGTVLGVAIGVAMDHITWGSVLAWRSALPWPTP